MRHLIIFTLLALAAVPALASRGRLLQEIQEAALRGRIGNTHVRQPPIPVSRQTTSSPMLFTLHPQPGARIAFSMSTVVDEGSLEIAFSTRAGNAYPVGRAAIAAAAQATAAAETLQRRFVRYMYATLRANGLSNAEFRVISNVSQETIAPRHIVGTRLSWVSIPQHALNKLDIGAIEEMVARLSRL